MFAYPLKHSRGAVFFHFKDKRLKWSSDFFHTGARWLLNYAAKTVDLNLLTLSLEHLIPHIPLSIHRNENFTCFSSLVSLKHYKPCFIFNHCMGLCWVFVIWVLFYLLNVSILAQTWALCECGRTEESPVHSRRCRRQPCSTRRSQQEMQNVDDSREFTLLKGVWKPMASQTEEIYVVSLTVESLQNESIHLLKSSC